LALKIKPPPVATGPGGRIVPQLRTCVVDTIYIPLVDIPLVDGIAGAFVEGSTDGMDDSFF
jgi:hypothetical protein